MRTTLTIEDDLAARIDKALATRKISLKALVNDALRRGLDDMDRPVELTPEYIMRTVDLGECHIPNLDSVADVVAYGEGEAFR